MMGTSYKDFKAELLKNSEIKKEYDALQPEYEIIRAMIEARNASGMTQQQLSEKTGIKQGDISRLENANGNPSLRTLKRLAAGMGMQLHLSFTPINESR